MTPTEMEPLLWLAAFAVVFGVHLFIHPQSRDFRHAIRWMKSNPAPMFILAASLIIIEGLNVWPGGFEGSSPTASPLEPWQNVWISCWIEGWKSFASLFHHAVAPPPLFFNVWMGALIQSLVAALSQVWFCCYYVNTQRPFVEDGLSFRHAMVRFPNILWLALCQLPWWLLQGSAISFSSPLLRNLLLPEYFLILAALPFAIAVCTGSFLKAGSLSLNILKQHWATLLLFALSAVPMLTLLEYTLRTSRVVMPTGWAPLGVIGGSTISAFLHVWLYASIAPSFLRSSSPTPTVTSSTSIEP